LRKHLFHNTWALFKLLALQLVNNNMPTHIKGVEIIDMIISNKLSMYKKIILVYFYFFYYYNYSRE